jgi:hypothetical protein
MLKEALQFFFDVSVKSKGPHELKVDDQRLAHYIVDGHYVTVPRPPRPRAHEVATLDSLVALANRFKRIGENPMVWYDHEGVGLIIDDTGHRIDTVTLVFDRSDQWNLILVLKGERYDHKTFVRLLRTHLSDALPAGDLLEKIRTLRFENGAITNTTVKRQEESLGKTITARVDAGKVEIPEEVVLSVPMYNNPGEEDRYPIRCIVDVDAEFQKFALIPVPGAIEEAYKAASRSVATRLEATLDKEVPFYFGNP